jgi:predicted amidohydrolase
MKIYCVQSDIVWENKPANYDRVQKLLAAAKLEQGSLVLLPEMFATGFSMNMTRVCEGKSRETETFLAHAAKEFGVYLLAGVVTASDGRGRNEAVVFSPAGEELCRYCKMQPFTLGGEAKHYVAGNGTVLFHWQNCLVAPFICYDLRFPELFRAAVRQGAHLFAVIANWPIARIQHWVTLLQARAIENQAYVAGTNRCGTDPKLTYNGRSLIVDPHGNILSDAAQTEGVISAEVDLKALITWRADFPALKDMRKDLNHDARKE